MATVTQTKVFCADCAHYQHSEKSPETNSMCLHAQTHHVISKKPVTCEKARNNECYRGALFVAKEGLGNSLKPVGECAI